MKQFALSLGLLVLSISVVNAQEKTAEAPEKKAPPPPTVGFIVAQPQAVELTKNLPGRLAASRDAVVRTRVTGIVQKRLFKEGAYVKAGQQLFKIDDAAFRTALASAKEGQSHFAPAIRTGTNPTGDHQRQYRYR